MHLFSNSLSNVAKISSLSKSEFFPASISCRNNFNQSQSSSGSPERNNIFEDDFPETPEADTIKPGDLSFFS